MSLLLLGATSPIARELGHRYAERGLPVFVAARDAGEAERIAADLAIRHSVKTAHAAFDATALDTHPGLVAEAEASVGPLTVVVLAFGDMGAPADDLPDPANLRHVIDVNFTGAATLAECAAALMAPRGEGTIIGLASVAGDRGRQSNYLYGSAKGAFALYLQGLRNRLSRAGVRVLTVKLGFVDTRMTFGMQTGIPIADPADVSRAIVAAADRGENVIYYPRFWRGIMGVIRTIPEEVFKRLSL